MLSDVEARRRAAYVREDDRARFTLGAVLLRLIAGARLRLDPAAVRVDRTCPSCGRPHGRPRIPDGGLHVSVTHSGDVTGIAATAVGPVGVDVEIVRSFEYRAMLDDVLGPEERKREPTLEEFFRYWTRKEAVLKATGAGLAVPLWSVVVTPPDRAPDVVRYDGGPKPALQMMDCPPAPGYEGAVTVLSVEPVAFGVRDAGVLLRGSG
jgi:4'-phosphopantetheinyl transferase